MIPPLHPDAIVSRREADPDQVTHEWAVRWPQSIHDTEVIEDCRDQAHAEQVARDYSTEECVGEVVTCTVTRTPWQPATR